MSRVNGLNVFRSKDCGYEHVGMIEFTPGSVLFQYDGGYMRNNPGEEISPSLPFEDFSAFAPTKWFAGLLPEGDMRRAVSQSTHANETTLDNVLKRLNSESVGGLVFSTEDFVSKAGERYEPIDGELFERFAKEPLQVAYDQTMNTRMSLAGEMPKMGLALRGGKWFLPFGFAPSTHIVKAARSLFPNQTLNEAFCMEVARQYGFDVAESHLIDAGSPEPLIAIKRFDRLEDLQTGYVLRLHQEDFMQAFGTRMLIVDKYEPTDGRWFERAVSLVRLDCKDGFSDSMYFLEQCLFNFAIGNTDNHLKNHSYLYDKSWKSKSLSPVYDIVCCTIYPNLDREMGIALSDSRKIDDVTASSISDCIAASGLNHAVALSVLKDFPSEFREALDKAKNCILSQYQSNDRIASGLEKVANAISEDAQSRLRNIE